MSFQQQMKSLHQVQDILKTNSFRRYMRLLSSLLDAHKEYGFLESFASALRSKDFRKLYSEADSLSKQQYVDATQHLVANQFALLVKKYPWPPKILDLQPRDAAIASFNASERRCKRQNAKHAFLWKDPGRDLFYEEFGTAQRWIRSVIGVRPTYKWVFSECGFGPGASIGVHGDSTNSLAKLIASRWSVNPSALHHSFAGLMENSQYAEQLFEHKGGFYCIDYEEAFKRFLLRVDFVDNNTLSFVAKTAKTERTIAVEPLMSSFVQKGIDVVLRKKLLNVGLDLSDQSKNQKFAREGSLSDQQDPFVTIDLRAASDSISTMIVKRLIPEEWFDLLNRTRSPRYELDGVLTDYHKFCNMGNGFCFPLQTLIFSSACVACDAGAPGVDFIVYGDDIIVRQSRASKLISLLKDWGFKVNTDKTFLEGPFRESCGADWFAGEDVRPFTLDYALDTVPNVFKFLNLSQRSDRTSQFFSSVRKQVINLLPTSFQFFRPLIGEADTGIDSIGDEHLTAPTCLYDHRRGKFQWLELVTSPHIDLVSIGLAKDEPWLIGIALQGVMSIAEGQYAGLPKVALRNRTKARVVRKNYVSTSNWLPTR